MSGDEDEGGGKANAPPPPPGAARRGYNLHRKVASSLQAELGSAQQSSNEFFVFFKANEVRIKQIVNAL